MLKNRLEPDKILMNELKTISFINLHTAKIESFKEIYAFAGNSWNIAELLRLPNSTRLFTASNGGI